MKTDGSERKISILPPSDHLEQTISETLSEILKQWRRKLGYYSLFAAVPAMLAGSTNDARAEDALIPEAKTSGREAGFLGKRKRGLKPPFFRQASNNRLPYQKGKMGIVPSIIGGNDDCPGDLVPTGTYTAASPYVDSGDTTGANNTVSTLYYYYYWYGYYYYYSAYGPDRIYSFNVHNLGANPRIQVTTTSPTYRPMIYLLADDQGCPAGTDNQLWNWVAVDDSRWGSGNTATVPIPTWSGSRMYHLFVDSSVADDAGAFTVTIQDVEVGANRPPNATDDSVTAYQDSEWSFSVLDNDTDPDRNWLTVSGVTQGNNGSVVNGGRYVLYTPNPGFTGVDTFTYTASDGQGGSDTATVTVTVSPNSPPVANDDVATVHSGFNSINVFTNDSDPDGNALSLSSVTQGSNGTVGFAWLDGRYVPSYTPNAGFAGVDTFTYTVTDGRGGYDTATVTVTVIPNREPTANDDTALVAQNSGSNTLYVLANDSDPDNNSLSVSSVTQGSNGSVVNNGSYVSYTPNQGFTGIDTFTYTTSDGQGGSDTATVTVAVAANFALASNGGTASASSTFSSSFPASGANNGDRRGVNWGSGGGWNDATVSSYPDWLEISFNGAKSIRKIDVFTVQDNYTSPSEPWDGMGFSNYGITAFDVQYRSGSDWVTVPGGSITNNNRVWRSISLSTPIETTGIRIRVNAALTFYSRITEVEAWGLAVEPIPPPTGPRTNVALGANGGTASASSTYSSAYPTSGAINGDRNGNNWGAGGGWNDATPNSQPDSLEVTFNGEQTISEIDVFTIQDNYQNPSQPSESMTFSQYGITAFDVQFWNGTSWVLVPGGSITSNNLVWRKLTFDPIRTSKIRVVVTEALAAYSRIVEVEAWTTADDPQDPPPPPPRSNFALAANGGTASASSTFSSSFPTAAANNGDRKGSGWGNGGGWNDSSASSYPDWLQIDFNGTKMIDEIDVFTLQDNYQNPSEPTESSTFTQYGITSFNVQYWDGSSWITVPGGSITNNNKVWTKLTFSAIQTTRIRILVNSSMLIYSRIVEVEAHGTN